MRVVLGLALTAAVAGPACAGEVEEHDAAMARELGILGHWAVDCSTPASVNNPHEQFSLGSEGAIHRVLTMHVQGLDGLSLIGKIGRVGDDKWNAIWVRDADNSFLSVTIQTAGRRHRTWTSKGMDVTYARDGVFVNSGKPTPWFTKCD